MRGNFFIDMGVCLPTNSNGGHKLFGGGHYGIFNNLPAPQVFDISGHACMKIGDVLTQHFADGRGFEFTEITSHSSDQDSNWIKHGIYGYKAMDLLIEKMKKWEIPVGITMMLDFFMDGWPRGLIVSWGHM